MRAAESSALSAEQLGRVFAVLERVDRAADVATLADATLEALGSVYGFRNTTFFVGPTYAALFMDPDPLLNGFQRTLFREYRGRWDRHDVFSRPPEAAVLHRTYAAAIDARDPVSAADRPYLDWLAGHGLENLAALRVGPGGRHALFGVFGPSGTVGPEELAALRLLGRQLDALVRHLPDRAAAAAPPLPPRLAETADLVRRGMTNAMIARTMQLSEDTVKKYVSRLLARTGARSRTELALLLHER
ncbi:helix-turn-helix transcriptional regulator [Pseudonocardia alni]|uniref:helix-turn-helix transcriptional regulator n=1 Tax=Pseudonocardia alni TaxID=33907 RepID=UPI003327A612